MTERFDAIVIGAGQAGPALCARLDREGLRTALVERKRLGGTCVDVGCIPTKTLVASAHAVHMARRGSEYGFTATGVSVDMHAVKARKSGRRILAAKLPMARVGRAREAGETQGFVKTVLAALLAVALVACGREEPGRVPAGDPADQSAKSVGKKANPPESAPTGADPMKEGY